MTGTVTNSPPTIAIIPARANSKSIKNKNMRLLKGKPVLYWTIDLVKRALEEGLIDLAVFTTESKEYRASVIGQYRDEEIMDRLFILLRDPSLSHDWVQNDDVVMDVIRKLDVPEGAIGVLLQPTSPFRKYEHLHRAVRLKQMRRGEGTTISGHLLNKGFFWSVDYNGPTGFVGGYIDHPPMSPIGHDPTRRLGRQWDKGYKQHIFKEDGSIYVFDWETTRYTRTFRNPPFYPLITEEIVDLDEPEDWNRVSEEEELDLGKDYPWATPKV